MSDNSPPVPEYVSRFTGDTKLTAGELVEVFNRFDTDGNGYIQAEELDAFLHELFRNSKEDPTSQSVKEFREWIALKTADQNRDGRIDLDELSLILPTEENFLHKFRTGSRISSVDFIKIWNQYDKDGNGYLEPQELKGLIYDLFATRERKDDIPLARKVEQVVDHLYKKTGRVQLNDLYKLLPVEMNFLAQLPEFKNLTKAQFEEVFAYYDKDKSGTIEGDELTAFIKDLLEKNTRTGATMEEVEKHKDYVMHSLDRNGDNKVDKRELRMFLMGAGKSCQPCSPPSPPPAPTPSPTKKKTVNFKYAIMFGVFAFILYILVFFTLSMKGK